MSGVLAVSWEGQDLYIPGAYSKRNTKGNATGGATSSGIVLIGECRAGIPFNATTDYPNPEDRINWVSNTLELNAILRDGPAYYGALFALTPSNQEGVNGPSQVGVIRVNKATQSSRTVLNTESAAVLDIKSKDYGLYTNQIRTKISAGTNVANSYKVVAKIEDTTITIDDIIDQMFSIQYTGNGAACVVALDPGTQVLVTITGANSGDSPTITTTSTTGIVPGMVLYAGGTADITGPVVGVVVSIVTDTSITIDQHITNANSGKTFFFKSGMLTMSSADTPADNIGVDLTGYDTVGNLVAYLQTLTKYSVALIGDGTKLVSKLDKILVADALSIKTQKTICATLQEIIDQINANSSILVATLHTAAVRRLPTADADYVFLTGGVEGNTPVTQDYQDALDQICMAVDLSLLGVMTSDLGIQSAVSAHCTYMSGIIGRNERQACFGCGLTDPDDTIKSNAQAINNSLAGYCGTGIQRYDKNGILQTWDAYYKACEILGMAAGNLVTFSPTNKMINAIKATRKYTPPEKIAFIRAGVMVAESSNQGGIRTVRAITTYQTADLILNEWQGVRLSLFITKDHRQYVESRIGEPGDATALESLKNAAISRLDYYVEQGYFVVDPQFGNAYRNVQFTITGDVFKITYEATIVITINFILTTANFVVIGQIPS